MPKTQASQTFKTEICHPEKEAPQIAGKRRTKKGAFCFSLGSSSPLDTPE
jgi:hypothetical protein